MIAKQLQPNAYISPPIVIHCTEGPNICMYRCICSIYGENGTPIKICPIINKLRHIFNSRSTHPPTQGYQIIQKNNCLYLVSVEPVTTSKPKLLLKILYN